MRKHISKSLACPVHKVEFDHDYFCSLCGIRYPQVNGVPILINDQRSVFQKSDFIQNTAYEGASGYSGSLDDSSGLRKFYRRFIYWLGESTPVRKGFDANQAVSLILKDKPNAEILVVGAGETVIAGNATYTDVAFGANVQYIADAHDLPFLECTFDAILAVAVLEHVVDPQACVSEFRRVLKPRGYVYAETPFMQPVHMREYDFTRFTYLGHRRLFRYFEDIDSGIALGPCAGASHVLRLAISALSDRPIVNRLLRLLALFFTLPLRWLDYLTMDKLGSYDSASAFYFFGRLAEQPISDRSLLEMYRGS